jgi:SepF-like predicted cell division protein (DUF552 family)
LPLLKKPLRKGKDDVQTVETDQYIDLGALYFQEDSPLAGNGMIKVAEVYRFEDVTAVSQPVYNGNIVLIDYSPIENDQQTLKKITNELKNIARDTGGHRQQPDRGCPERHQDRQAQDKGRLQLDPFTPGHRPRNPVSQSQYIVQS